MAFGDGGIGGDKILKKIMVPPLSVIKIVKYCGGVWGGGGIGGAKILKKTMAPPSLSLRLLSIVAFGEEGGRQNHAKDNQWRSKGQGGKLPPVAARRGRQRNIVALGEGGIGGAKILIKIMAPPFSVIKIVKYCGVGGGEHWGRQNPKNIMAPKS